MLNIFLLWAILHLAYIFDGCSISMPSRTIIGKNIRITTKQNYSDAKEYKSNIEKEIKDLFESYNFNVMDDTCSNCDAYLTIEIAGTPLGAYYSSNGRSNWYWVAAKMEGNIQLLSSGKNIFEKSFSGNTGVPNSMVSGSALLPGASWIGENRYASFPKRPEEAPFQEALKNSEFYKLLNQLLDNYKSTNEFFSDIHEQYPFNVASTPDGRYVLVGNQRSLNCYAIQGGFAKRISSSNTIVNKIEISHDGQYALSIDMNDSISLLWDIKRGELLRQFRGQGFHSDVQCAAFSPDDRFIAIGYYNGWLNCYEVGSGKQIASFKGWGFFRVESVFFSNDDRYIITSADTVIKLFEVQSGKEIKSFKGQSSFIGLCCDTSGSRLLSVDCSGSIKILDINTFEEIGSRQIQISQSSISSLENQIYRFAFSPSRRYLLFRTVYLGKRIDVFDVQTGRIVKTLNYIEDINDMKFFGSDRYAITCSASNGIVRMWKILE